MNTTISEKGIPYLRLFTADGECPYEAVQWEDRDAVITNGKNEVIFSQKAVRVPADWSQTATNIVASKYFHGQLGSPEREFSVRQLVERVVNTITQWGKVGGYFRAERNADNFRDELAHLMLHQKACFNSPVWFNVGVKEHRGYGWYWNAQANAVQKLEPGVSRPQCSACFILSVEDSLESILDLAKSEAMLFKWGSGSGVNLSTLREEDAVMSGGGRASGPLSFMQGLDTFAGIIKSGGKKRRAAKMVILNADHPDIEKFIWCKAREEKKAHALIDAGYDGSFEGEAYRSIFFQNANNSVRVTDEFMQAVVEDGAWFVESRQTGKPGQEYRARDLMKQICEATHQCGDPGLQFDTTINRWHTAKVTGRVNASNPCSEHMFLDDSACNLASLNLLKFVLPDGTFDVWSFRHAVETMILAQEILVDNSSYPTEKIAQNTHDFRPLGLGYANLGALLMRLGIPYDSDRGRDLAGAITAVMSGQAYITSAAIAETKGPCPGYEVNNATFLEVIKAHCDEASKLAGRSANSHLSEEMEAIWHDALDKGKRSGFRNAQTTVLAPTGTIGFMMDCCTTGIEPELALVKYKKLVGGGVIKIVNNTVPQALVKLGYSANLVERIVSHIDSTGTIEGANDLKPEHLPVFDCSFRPQNGTRFIHHMGHVKMLAATQPFISGAISKTINMPEESTVEDIMDAYIKSWRLGLKSVAIYRDNSKRIQPLSTAKTDAKPEPAGREAVTVVRRKMPEQRNSITRKFAIAGHSGYITVGLYEDGTPGELFIRMAKEGSTISGLMDSFATAVSYGLQYGVPLRFFVDKFSHVRFEPSGWTGNPQIPYAKSIMDYIFRWLELTFLGGPSSSEAGESKKLRRTEPEPQQSLPLGPDFEDAPLCSECGGLMTRNGSCYKCANCGGTSGCS